MTYRDFRQGLLFCHITDHIKALVFDFANLQGISMDEYVRSLILADLGRKGAFLRLLKEAEP